jgi:anaerobic magnesium-protoporphyrin IX monomethyl ester cyclase
MRILLLNPPHPAVSSRCHEGRMPPLGHLAVGGPLIDAGHTVRLVDAEFGPLSLDEIVGASVEWAPDAVFVGHSGSTSAHPGILRIAQSIKAAMPHVGIVYGGIYPTYHAREILTAHREIDAIVRGEGEATSLALVEAMEADVPLGRIPGIAYRENGVRSPWCARLRGLRWISGRL